MQFRVAAVLLLLGALSCPAPARADVAYTITLTDEQSAALQEQTRLVNAQRRSATGRPSPNMTPAEMLQGAARGLAEGWEHGQHETSGRKAWSERSTREKQLACRRQKMTTCPQ